MDKICWEAVLESAGVSEWDSKPSDFVKINSTNEKYKDYKHCSHCFIFARNTSPSSKYNGVPIVLMQMRFDGRLGFPGGGVDIGETPVQGLNRELGEESGWFETEGPVREEHHLCTHVNEKGKMVLHFYTIEVSEEKIKEIEAKTLQASDYGGEVLGTCRVPLYTIKHNQRGFPSFLRNNFAGNSKIQLIEAVVNLKLLSPKSVMSAIYSKPFIKSVQN